MAEAGRVRVDAEGPVAAAGVAAEVASASFYTIPPTGLLIPTFETTESNVVSGERAATAVKAAKGAVGAWAKKGTH